MLSYPSAISLSTRSLADLIRAPPQDLAVTPAPAGRRSAGAACVGASANGDTQLGWRPGSRLAVAPEFGPQGYQIILPTWV